ncbi:enolase C-terminal domain-like protein [Halocatena pleomorpha]
MDFRGRASTPMAKRLVHALEPYEPMFIEEPVLPEYNDTLGPIALAALMQVCASISNLLI